MAFRYGRYIGLGGGRQPQEASGPAGETLLEEQSGDPDVVPERLAVSQRSLRVIMRTAPLDLPCPDGKVFAQNLLRIAEWYVGVSRYNMDAQKGPSQVAEFLNLFDIPYKTTEGFMPFCAAGLSYVACQTLLELSRTNYDQSNWKHQFHRAVPHLRQCRLFTPSPACEEIKRAAIDAGGHQWVPAGSGMAPQPGWLILYNWRGGKRAQHIGLVMSANARRIETLEFNTSGAGNHKGGAVAHKVRGYDYVLGYVRLY